MVDHGWTLRGGTEPDAAALTNLWRIAAWSARTGRSRSRSSFSPRTASAPATSSGSSPTTTAGTSCSGSSTGGSTWRIGSSLPPPGWASRSNGPVRAARRRRRPGCGPSSRSGTAVMIWPDRFHIGYWHLPYFDGHGGHPVIAYAEDGDRIHIDDRTVAPLTVAGDDVDRARSRVGSYQHAMLAVRSSDQQIDGDVLRAAVQDGLRTTATHLGGTSTSFALPALAKWSRLLVDERNAKAWPNVFADRRALLGALLSVWEGVSPAGMTGGNLRLLFADGLEQAADLLGIARARHGGRALARHRRSVARPRRGRCPARRARGGPGARAHCRGQRRGRRGGRGRGRPRGRVGRALGSPRDVRGSTTVGARAGPDDHGRAQPSSSPRSWRPSGPPSSGCASR